jgi:acyl-CoA thioester hydrolase
MAKASPPSDDEGEAPLALHREVVLPEWIDYNGHMNVAFYVLAFDHATDAFLDRVGLGIDYRRRNDCSVFIVEAHVTYEREVGEGDALSFTTQVMGVDAKRMHLFHRMYLAGEEALVATNELMILHVDLGSRRTAALPATALESIEAIARAHADLPPPPQAGRVIAIRPQAA